MTDEPNWKRWMRGLIAASLLAAVCVCVSALFIAWKDRPPIYYRWPHSDPLIATLVLTPAFAFWWYYFTHHWRGRALLSEVLGVTIKQPRFWLYLVLASAFWWLLIMQPGIRSAA